MIPKKKRGDKEVPYLTRYSKNEREAFVQRQYVNAGWIVLKNGWPDLFCYNKNTGEVELIEVKALSQYTIKKNGGHRLGRSQDQVRMHQYLERAGLKVKIIHIA